MIGTLLNVSTVVVGATAGMVLGARLPDRVREIVMNGLGLTTVLIGLSSALGTKNVLYVLGSVVVGGIVGELLRIEDGLDWLGRWFERRLTRPSDDDPALDGDEGEVPPKEQLARASRRSNFSKGFVTASLVFCVGPMTILGSIQDGLTGDFTTLAVKSMLDGFAGMIFASTLGVGVMLSALVVLVYQGALTLGAAWVQGLLSEAMVREMTATGGLLIVGIGLGLLDLKRIRVANLLPAIFIAPLAVAVVPPLLEAIGRLW